MKENHGGDKLFSHHGSLQRAQELPQQTSIHEFTALNVRILLHSGILKNPALGSPSFDTPCTIETVLAYSQVFPYPIRTPTKQGGNPQGDFQTPGFEEVLEPSEQCHPLLDPGMDVSR